MVVYTSVDCSVGLRMLRDSFCYMRVSVFRGARTQEPLSRCLKRPTERPTDQPTDRPTGIHERTQLDDKKKILLREFLLIATAASTVLG